jgi:Tfp pilus assembly protein PilF|tara:strand:- start:65 stop:478 length:414 start_codon:yes stop_codon:yes gene_type:complete
MISNIHNTYIKGEKAFNNKKFTEAKKHLVSVVEHDKNHYAAYLLLFEILNKSNSPFLKVVVNELKRLNPKLSINYNPIKTKKKNSKKTDSIVTISYIKLMIQQGKKIQAKKNLRSIIKYAKTKKQISEAEQLLNTLK